MRFSKWVTLKEEAAPQGVGAPEHQQGDDTMDIPGLIQKRLHMLIDEIEKKRNMPRDQQVQILQQVIQTMSNQFGLGKAQVQKATKGAMQPGAPAQPPAGPPPAMPPGPPGAVPSQAQPMA